MIPRLYVPLLEPEDVVRHLGKQEKHWKEGRSAHALACVWAQSNALPPRVAAVFKNHSVFKSAELVDAFLERKVDLKSKGRPSQTDLLAVIGIDLGLAVVAVEGKAGETFGERVAEWLEKSAKKGRDGTQSVNMATKKNHKESRLKGLCSLLGISKETALPLRYQLLHRSASAILEAGRYRTPTAVLLVHSFSVDSKGFEDFEAFLKALGFKDAARNTLAGPVRLGDVSLYAGWVADEAPKVKGYLDALDNYAANLSKDGKRIRAWCKERRSK